MSFVCCPRSRKHLPSSAKASGLYYSTPVPGDSGLVRPEPVGILLQVEVGPARSCTGVAVLIDTNVLVYRFDLRFPKKQEIATGILRSAIESGDARIPHQVVIEFIIATTRGGPDAGRLSALDALREAEDILAQYPILYPNGAVLRTALGGFAAYGMSWFDAHLWAYAEVYGLDEIISEDFQHGRLYGSVMARDPFVETG